MAVETTLVLVKPDGVQRGLSGEIIGRLERTGLKIVGMKFMQVTRDLAEKHYAEHKGKGFYEGLVSYITSAPVVALALEGPEAIAVVRKIMGSTRPAEAVPGTIRGDLALEVGRNLIHGSANASDAQREVGLFFGAKELLRWERTAEKWVRE
jgi:nucleoside-diphosphate kinase